MAGLDVRNVLIVWTDHVFMHIAIVVYAIASVEKVFRTIGSLLLFKTGEMDRSHQWCIDHSLYLDLQIEVIKSAVAKYRYNESFQKSQIFELKPRNRNLNSLLCEIFTYMAVKLGKSGIQSNSMRLTDRLVLDVNRQSWLPICEGNRYVLYQLCSQNIMFQKHNIALNMFYAVFKISLITVLVNKLIQSLY